MIRLVLSDVDGTLLPLGHRHVSERTRAAIREVQRAGVRFGLASGRDYAELLRIFCEDDSAFQTGMLSNGKKVMADGDLVSLTLIDPDALMRLVEVVSAFPHSFVTTSPLVTDQSNPMYFINAAPADVEPWAELLTIAPTFVSEVPSTELIAATIACSEEQEVMDRIREQASVACPEFDFMQPAPRWCDVLPKGLNKGTALPVLLDALGIAPDEVVVFGDAENDLPLLGAVEHSVAVANATPAAAAAARWHIGACEDDAVADALLHIADAARTGAMPAFMVDESTFG